MSGARTGGGPSHNSGLTLFGDDDVRIVRIGPLGPGDNNAYIVRDMGSARSLLVDMPAGDETMLAAIASEGPVERIVATHWHADHWMSYDAIRAATGAPVLVGAREVRIPEERIDGRLGDGEELRLGSTRVTVVHTPGHTPGSICLRVGRAVITGDTLFSGGPGRTWSKGDLETLLASITARLLPLPPDTLVLPGHGEDTTIAESRRGYRLYTTHPKPPGFHGDVSWE